MARKMTKRQYREVFGIEPPKRLVRSQKRRASEINALFDSFQSEFGMSSLAVFTAAATALHGEFLKNVRDCPKFVIEYCQKELAPGSATWRRKATKSSKK
ncbi:MAG: hypothetical protein AAB472_00185 [Patescibacteria group bacterium]